MKTRIISALAGTVVLLAIVFCPFVWVFALAAAILSALAVWELLYNTGVIKNKLLVWGSALFAGCEVLLGSRAFAFTFHEYMPSPRLALYAVALRWSPFLLCGLYLLFVLILFWIHRNRVVWQGYALTIYAVLGFAALACLRMMPRFGLPYALLPMVIAWMSDTGAYFVGTFFGKHKMAPVISPKKSWEGFFGGWVISVGLTALYGVICNWMVDPLSALRVDVGLFAVLATVLSPLSVVGDLLASMVKRRSGIKDYGNIMPGHGGVMDRFDSVIFIAPLVFGALWLFG